MKPSNLISALILSSAGCGPAELPTAGSEPLTIIPPVILGPAFDASGAGEITTPGSATAGSTIVYVTSSASFVVGQGVRVARAGTPTLLDRADAGGWTGNDGARAAPSLDRVEGTGSVACTFGALSGNSTCGRPLSLPQASFERDELRVWLKSSAPLSDGQIQLELGNDKVAVLHMPVPAQPTAAAWSEVYLRLEARAGSGAGALGRIQVRCRFGCTGLTVWLDDLWLTKDLVTTIRTILSVPTRAGTMTTFELASPASRTTSATISHDDTAAIQRWLNTSPGAPHWAPSGLYLLFGPSLVHSGTHIICASPDSTTFRSGGPAITGASMMLRSSAHLLGAAPHDISIEGCTFDPAGWNRIDFSNVIHIDATDCDAGAPCPPAENITIRNNRFIDSVFEHDRAKAMKDCDLGQEKCATRQRHSILVATAAGVLIEDNELDGGGRIKVMRATDVQILRNQLDFVNDNAITIVDSGPCSAGCTTARVTISQNRIIDPMSAGIFFGLDGEENDDPDLRVEDLTINDNEIQGFFQYGIIGIIPGGGLERVTVRSSLISQHRTRPVPHVTGGGIYIMDGPLGGGGRDVAVEDNVVVALDHAWLDPGAIAIRGRFSDLGISHNTLGCPGCALDPAVGMEKGLHLFGAGFDHLRVEDNRIWRAGTAMVVQAAVSPGVFVRNDLGWSSASGWPFGHGQLLLDPQGGSIVAWVSENTLHDGRGIQCTGPGVFGLSSGPTGSLAEDNTFVAISAGPDIDGCP